MASRLKVAEMNSVIRLSSIRAEWHVYPGRAVSPTGKPDALEIRRGRE